MVSLKRDVIVLQIGVWFGLFQLTLESYYSQKLLPLSGSRQFTGCGVRAPRHVRDVANPEH